MDDGKHCPDCGKDIGIWPIFSAGLPNRIWCPHCSSRLKYRVTAGMLLVLTLLVVGLTAGAYYISSRYAGMNWRLWAMVFAGLVIVPWIVVELAIAAYLRSRRKLERVDAGKDRKMDEIA